jgi:hypothetical protein
LAANAAGEPPVAAITATFLRTRSAASAGSRSNRPSAQRYSTVTFSPSAKPASFRPRRNARRRSAFVSGEVVWRKPITGIAACCARAASGHAAVPPTNEMKSRRFMCPQIEPPNLPHRRGAETALCTKAKLIVRMVAQGHLRRSQARPLAHPCPQHPQ